MTIADDGEWSLLLASNPPSGDRGASRRRPVDSMQRELMWGKTQGSSISLFDATLTNTVTDYKTYSHEVWRGPWHVDSPSTWFDKSDPVQSIHIEFTAALPWSDLPPGKGRKHNLDQHWDREDRVFTRPEPVVHKASVNGAAVELHIGVRTDQSDNRVEVELESHFIVTGEVEIGEVLKKWVAPLHDLVGLFWLGNPGIVSVEAEHPDGLGLSRICYSGRFAPADPSEALGSSHKFAPFTTVEGLAAHGYSFDDFLTSYWDCRDRGFGRAIQRLHESQDSHLDTSIDARMLSAIKSLESSKRHGQGSQGRSTSRAPPRTCWTRRA